MQLPVLLGLAALWAAVLLPDFLKRRNTRRSADSINAFSRNLNVLGNANPVAPRRVGTSRPTVANNVLPFTPRPVGAPRPAAAPSASAAGHPAQVTHRSPAAQRRQDVIVALGALSLLSLLAMLTFGGAMLYIHLLIDVALLAYLGAVLNVSRVEKMRSRVAYLPHQASPLLTVTQSNRRSAAR